MCELLTLAVAVTVVMVMVTVDGVIICKDYVLMFVTVVMY